MRPPVTVCMATFNGARHLKDQIDSILAQLEAVDELLIVDDCSTDDTLNVINGYHDPRIKLVVHQANRRHVKSFEDALAAASNRTILLTDQDDVWTNGRLNFLVSSLTRHNALLVSSIYECMTENGDVIAGSISRLPSAYSSRHMANILNIFLGRMSYFGCTMALDSDLLKTALPIPDFVESHDLWLAMIANLRGRNRHEETVTVMRRLHSINLTPARRRSLLKVLKTRIYFLVSIAIILKRLAKNS